MYLLGQGPSKVPAYGNTSTDRAFEPLFQVAGVIPLSVLVAHDVRFAHAVFSNSAKSLFGDDNLVIV